MAEMHKYLLRLPLDLMKWLIRVATRDNRSVNRQIVTILEEKRRWEEEQAVGQGKQK